MDIAIHLACPFQKAPEMDALRPQEFPEFKETDLRHLDAGVGFDSPEQIGAAPGRDAMAASGSPEEAEHLKHWSQYNAWNEALSSKLSARSYVAGVGEQEIPRFARNDKVSIETWL